MDLTPLCRVLPLVNVTAIRELPKTAVIRVGEPALQMGMARELTDTTVTLSVVYRYEAEETTDIVLFGTMLWVTRFPVSVTIPLWNLVVANECYELALLPHEISGLLGPCLVCLISIENMPPLLLTGPAIGRAHLPSTLVSFLIAGWLPW